MSNRSRRWRPKDTGPNRATAIARGDAEAQLTGLNSDQELTLQTQAYVMDVEPATPEDLSDSGSWFMDEPPPMARNFFSAVDADAPDQEEIDPDLELIRQEVGWGRGELGNSKPKPAVQRHDDNIVMVLGRPYEI